MTEQEIVDLQIKLLDTIAKKEIGLAAQQGLLPKELLNNPSFYKGFVFGMVITSRRMLDIGKIVQSEINLPSKN